MSYDVKCIGMDVHKEAIVIAVLEAVTKCYTSLESVNKRVCELSRTINGERRPSWTRRISFCTAGSSRPGTGGGSWTDHLRGTPPYLGRVTERLMAMKCEFRKKNGERCGAEAQTGKSLCVFHDPERATQGQALGGSEPMPFCGSPSS